MRTVHRFIDWAMLACFPAFSFFALFLFLVLLLILEIREAGGGAFDGFSVTSARRMR